MTETRSQALIRRQQEDLIAANPRRMANAPIRNIWSKNGLDLADSAFSKVYLSETSFSQKDDAGETLKKFDLESIRFEELRTILIGKQNRMAMKRLIQVVEGGENLELLDQPQLINKATMVAHRDTVWNAAVNLATDSQEDVNDVYDKQLKCHAFGTFLLNALTNRAIQKLESAKSQWTVIKDNEEFAHGPLLFWFIVDAVKPNNDTLAQHTKEKLAKLKVTDFDHSVKEMLVEFDNLCTEVEVRLKGTVTEDEKISALWRALETMKDEYFARVVSDEKRLFRRTPVANRRTCADLIELFKREQTDLEADGKWNRPNKDSQILALTSILRSVVKQVHNVVPTGSNGGDESKGSSHNPSKSSRKPTPAWKYEREGDETEKVVDGKTHWWCPKHTSPATGSQGMWARHKPEDHQDKFRFNKKKVDETNSGPAANSSEADKPEVQVDSRLLNALSSGADIQGFLDEMGINETQVN
jgi:hypothetical protein